LLTGLDLDNALSIDKLPDFIALDKAADLLRFLLSDLYFDIFCF